MSFRQPPAWLSDETVAPPILLGPLLQALTPLQQAGMWWRARKKPTQVAAEVISFGNITAGGTGKTPAVIERAALEVAAGKQVAVITRGYGSTRQAEPVVIAPHSRHENLARLVGDEPALILWRVPEVWIIKSADRVAGARAAIEAGCNCLILDDGFQSLALARDEDIVLLDATHPFGNGHLIPRGVLREPISSIKRATQVWLTRCDPTKTLDETLAHVTQLHGKPPSRLTRHAPLCFVRLCDGREYPLELVRDKKLVLACAIANPKAFEHTVSSLGGLVYNRICFPDHHSFTDHELPCEGMVIVTEKDAVRFSTTRENIYALRMCLKDLT